jgi:hypothetical protein
MYLCGPDTLFYFLTLRQPLNELTNGFSKI